MTVSGFSVPACRETRQLLGVYVVGAIDPAERTLVDEHLGQCAMCRDELAGLAGLPAMLSRVPVVDLERLSRAPSGLPEMAEPPAELLNSLLRKVSVKHRSRMWRGVTAVAAAALVAVGGTSIVSHLTRPATAPVTGEAATASNVRTGVTAVVDYSSTPWNSTTMRVQVNGIPAGTTCQFWVVGKDGRAYAGTWTVSASYGRNAWYTVATAVPASMVHSFQITAAGHLLVSIPAR